MAFLRKVKTIGSATVVTAILDKKLLVPEMKAVTRPKIMASFSLVIEA